MDDRLPNTFVVRQNVVGCPVERAMCETRDIFVKRSLISKHNRDESDDEIILQVRQIFNAVYTLYKSVNILFIT